jgi:hypothetical protein
MIATKVAQPFRAASRYTRPLFVVLFKETL